MSAIFGIITKNQQPIQPRWITCMLDKLRHRGPDGAHTWQHEDVALGHLMLHTTPESCFDKPPLEYLHWVITADVRLDNRKELFDLLAIAPSFRSKTTDSLLLAKAFEKWGKRCPEFLTGDFAFAIWDKRQRSLFCARDHAGVRQFYYYDSPDYFVFSSEIPAIAALDFVPHRLDEDSFANYLIFLPALGDQAVNTLIKNIQRLLPANWLSFENHSLSTSLYWKRNPDYRLKLKDEREYGLALRELMQQAIEDRMRTDFPVGVLLSGGLDSSSVACLAARSLAQKGKNLYSASSVLPLGHTGIEEDERKYVELVLAQEKNIIPKFVSAEGIGAFSNLPKIFDKTYEPANQFVYMDEALNQSLAPHTRVVLTGFLGDATVSNVGNLYLAQCMKEWSFRHIPHLLRSRRRVTQKSYSYLVLKHILIPMIPYDLREVIKKIIGKPPSFPYGILDSPASTSFLSEERAKEKFRSAAKLYVGGKTHFMDIWDTSFLALAFASDRELQTYQHQEQAHPLTDKRIIEFLWASPPECFNYQGYPRGYIRRALEGVLPEEILWRMDKTSFSPDFQSRIIKEIDELSLFLESEKTRKYGFYINISYILATLKDLKPARNWGDWDDRAVKIVQIGIQALLYLHWFETHSRQRN